MRHHRDENGHALVVRNGRSHHERTVQMGAGSVKIQAPRVNDRRPDRTFSSKILPLYMRRSPRLEEAVPVLYLRGLSTGDFSEALEVLLGSEAVGFSATTITRLLSVWQEEYKAWRKRSLAGKEYVYIWADGVYFNICLEEDRLACLLMGLGVQRVLDYGEEPEGPSGREGASGCLRYRERPIRRWALGPRNLLVRYCLRLEQLRSGLDTTLAAWHGLPAD
jgi:hypothetical protein